MSPGLYLHLPFCSAICPYCDFYVLTGDGARRAFFFDNLLAEIVLSSEQPWPSFVEDPPTSTFDTVYLGGGTPSLLEPERLHILLERARLLLPFAADPWIGLEANPEDVSPRLVAQWRDLGVRFLSLGIQSFDDDQLAFLGRRHRSRDGRRSVELALAAGFETVSIDLIYGLPGQRPEHWRDELATAIGLRPDHLSCYQLTIEDGTPFGFRRARGELTEATEGTRAELFFLTHRVLEESGFMAYEVSNFASDLRHRSRHNRKYWEHGPYLGLGPSAHSFAGRRRWWNERKIRPYETRMARGDRPIREHETLSVAQLCLERLLLGLRTPDGVDFDALPGGAGRSVWEANAARIERLAARRLVAVEGRRIRPTLAGLALAEAMARDFDIPPP